ncbi:MAG: hypothetical protein IPG88_27530 [Gemmatimonadetes bacterium]|nr:hypothetical protein [Gemmatimonadota bacterium]
MRQKIADYLIALVGLGVAGFRIGRPRNAAGGLDQIITLVNSAAAGEARTLYSSSR